MKTNTYYNTTTKKMRNRLQVTGYLRYCEETSHVHVHYTVNNIVIDIIIIYVNG